MNRRSFLRFLGLAPIAAPVLAMAAAAPRVFPFAHGIGLTAECGPEVVMPLVRNYEIADSAAIEWLVASPERRFPRARIWLADIEETAHPVDLAQKLPPTEGAAS